MQLVGVAVRIDVGGGHLVEPDGLPLGAPGAGVGLATTCRSFVGQALALRGELREFAGAVRQAAPGAQVKIAPFIRVEQGGAICGVGAEQVVLLELQLGRLGKIHGAGLHDGAFRDRDSKPVAAAGQHIPRDVERRRLEVDELGPIEGTVSLDLIELEIWYGRCRERCRCAGGGEDRGAEGAGECSGQ